ncbi:MAG: radical SAM protein [Smithella sp.]|nr:radical SAM protein [Smithella sp.]HQI71862.1 radical SAM protein [Smithella sp.]
MRNNIDILLMQPPHQQDANVPYLGREMPLGIAYLAAYMEKAGISVEILDLNISEHPLLELEEALKTLCPRFVGISSFTVDIPGADTLAGCCKSILPGVTTIVGGIHATALPQRTLAECEHFDYLIHGQGEVPLTRLIQSIKGHQDVRGINGLAYRNNGTITVNPRDQYLSLDDLPFPARHKLKIDAYAPHPQKYITLPNTGIFSSIGCPFRCSYCSVHLVHPRFTARSPENVVREMEECVQRYGIRDFRFFDDCLTVDRKHITDICNLIICKKLKLHWNCQSRVDKVDRELLALMKKAGCHQITYGIETGTRKGLQLINKKTTLEQAEAAIQHTKEVGLESGGSFLLGIPGETVEDIRDTIAFARKLSPDIATFYIVKAYPGTALFEKAIEKDREAQINWEDYIIQGSPLFDIGIPKETMLALVEEAYHRFYFRPRYVWQRLKKIFRSPRREAKIAFKGFLMVASYFRRR